MQKRILGQNLEVAVLGLGCMGALATARGCQKQNDRFDKKSRITWRNFF